MTTQLLSIQKLKSVNFSARQDVNQALENPMSADNEADSLK